MTKKKAYVLRIDAEKLDFIEKWAADEFRSINGQLEWIIDQALKASGRPYKDSSKNDETNENQNQ